jgi:hypothetical protein
MPDRFTRRWNVAATPVVTFHSAARTNRRNPSVISEPMVVVRILSGPRQGERFVTPLRGLTEGTLFRYFDDYYTFVRDRRTGRWGAIPVPTNNDAPRTTG